jgi:serine/threonine protein kinase
MQQDASSLANEATVKRVGRNSLALSGTLMGVGGRDESMRYVIMRKIGEGGYGAVYEGQDTYYRNHRVAIKSINLAGLSATEMIEATDGFNREVKLLTGLRHPHLPRVYDHFTDPEHWYLVMDYIDGPTLEAYLEYQRKQLRYLGLSFGGCLPLPEIFQIILQLCNVLEYLHTRQPPIIFRDLKPGNVMRAPNGHLYLIDFGIARHFKPGQTKDTIPLGSPGFAPPEQYGKRQTDPRADIYSLGALLHHLLTGDDPSLNAFKFNALVGVPPYLSGLERLLSDMLSLDPMNRPSTVRVVGQAIAAFARRVPPVPVQHQTGPFGAPLHFQQSMSNTNPHFAVFGAPPSTLPPLPRPTPLTHASMQPTPQGFPPLPHPTPQPPAMSLGPIARPPQLPVQPLPGQSFAGPLGQGQMMQMAPPRAQQAPQQKPRGKISRRALLIGGAASAALLGGSGLLLAMANRSERQQKIPPPTPTIPTPRPELKSGQTRTIAVQAFATTVSAFACSPSGQQVAVFDEGAIKIYDAQFGDQPQVLGEHFSIKVAELSWSPNGEQIAYRLENGLVGIRSVKQGSPEQIIQADGLTAIQALAWLSANKLLLIKQDNGMVVWDVALEKISYIIYAKNAKDVVAISSDGRSIAIGGYELGNVSIYRDGHYIRSITIPGASSMISLSWSERGSLLVLDMQGIVINFSVITDEILWQRYVSNIKSSPPAQVRWSPDGEFFAVTVGTSDVYLYDANGEARAIDSGHTGMVEDVAWLPHSSGRQSYSLISSSDDHFVRSWDFLPSNSYKK